VNFEAKIRKRGVYQKEFKEEPFVKNKEKHSHNRMEQEKIK